MFERRWLDVPRWSPVSKFAPDATQVSGRLYRVGDCVYLFTDGTEGDPGVGAVFWAQAPEVALSYMELRPLATVLPEGAGYCVAPGADVTGFQSLTYGGILSQAEKEGLLAEESASYGGISGEFLHCSITVPLKQFLFSDLDPNDGDEPIAIRFNLRA